jgi:hypothetical protein
MGWRSGSRSMLVGKDHRRPVPGGDDITSLQTPSGLSMTVATMTLVSLRRGVLSRSSSPTGLPILAGTKHTIARGAVSLHWGSRGCPLSSVSGRGESDWRSAPFPVGQPGAAASPSISAPTDRALVWSAWLVSYLLYGSVLLCALLYNAGRPELGVVVLLLGTYLLQYVSLPPGVRRAARYPWVYLPLQTLVAVPMLFAALLIGLLLPAGAARGLVPGVASPAVLVRPRPQHPGSNSITDWLDASAGHACWIVVDGSANGKCAWTRGPASSSRWAGRPRPSSRS